MRQKTFFLLTILGFVIVTLGLLFLAFNTDRKTTEILDAPFPEEIPPGEGKERSITAKHQFKDGTHIIAGEFDLPTPCHLLITRAVMRESIPEQVVVEFKVTTQNERLCAQVVTPTRFKIVFDAAERVIITATINDDGAALNLLQAGVDEDLNDFDVRIKE